MLSMKKDEKSREEKEAKREQREDRLQEEREQRQYKISREKEESETRKRKDTMEVLSKYADAILPREAKLVDSFLQQIAPKVSKLHM